MIWSGVTACRVLCDPGDMTSGDDDVTTVRTVLNELMRIAADLPKGLDSRLEFGVCNGENLQLIQHVDVDIYTERVDLHETGAASTAEDTGQPFIFLRAHHHPGDTPGTLLRGVASDTDAELRNLTDQDPE
jgi:hypothetical protein